MNCRFPEWSRCFSSCTERMLLVLSGSELAVFTLIAMMTVTVVAATAAPGRRLRRRRRRMEERRRQQRRCGLRRACLGRLPPALSQECDCDSACVCGPQKQSSLAPPRVKREQKASKVKRGGRKEEAGRRRRRRTGGGRGN